MPVLISLPEPDIRTLIDGLVEFLAAADDKLLAAMERHDEPAMLKICAEIDAKGLMLDRLHLAVGTYH